MDRSSAGAVAWRGAALCALALGGALATARAVDAQVPAESTAKTSLRLVDHEHLPVESLLPVLDSLALRRHNLPGVAPVYYQPALLGTSSASNELEATGLQTASLWLREGMKASSPTAAAGEALVVPRDGHEELAVVAATPDVVEPLFYALFLARLHARYEREPLFAGGLRRRALAAFGTGREELGETQEDDLAAEYMMASSAFASHLMMTANEIERARRRRAALGRPGLCEQLKRGVGLFSQWRKAFEESAFPVSTFSRAGAERTRNVSLEHRRWVLESLLPGSGWRGLAEDHARLCEGVP